MVAGCRSDGGKWRRGSFQIPAVDPRASVEMEMEMEMEYRVQMASRDIENLQGSGKGIVISWFLV